MNEKFFYGFFCTLKKTRDRDKYRNKTKDHRDISMIFFFLSRMPRMIKIIRIGWMRSSLHG